MTNELPPVGGRETELRLLREADRLAAQGYSVAEMKAFLERLVKRWEQQRVELADPDAFHKARREALAEGGLDGELQVLKTRGPFVAEGVRARKEADEAAARNSARRFHGERLAIENAAAEARSAWRRPPQKPSGGK